jgi:transposase InsO family protein
MPWKPIDVMDQKEKFVMEALREDVVFTELCRRYGISTVTGYYWKQRFLEEGRTGLHERSRRPGRNPDRLKEEVVCEIVRLKHAHESFGPEKIRVLYQKLHHTTPCLSSFKRVLQKAGLVRARKVRRRADPSSLPKVSLRPSAPNEVWTIDFKGWWHTDAGRCEPLTVRDSYSRYVLGVQAMATTRTEAVREQLTQWFTQYGLPKVIHSDNGAPFASTASPLGLSRLSAWWTALGITLSRSRPGHPQDNGGHERMHRDLEDYVQPLICSAGNEAQAILDQWRHEFNCVRPHRALQMRCPCEVYTKSQRPYTGTPDLIDYGHCFISRMVSNEGCLSLLGHKYFISTALNGWNLGLKHVSSSLFEVWFDHLHLGLIDSSAARFIWARPDEAPVS